MPRMDGRRFLELAKQDPRLKAIPVVMLTSPNRRPTSATCYERQRELLCRQAVRRQAVRETVRQVVNFWAHVGQLP